VRAQAVPVYGPGLHAGPLLRRGSAHHPTDDGLIASIERPERTRRDVARPTWDGVIAENQYASLAACARTLAVEGR